MEQIRDLFLEDLEQIRQLLIICWQDTYTNLLPDVVIQKVIDTWHSERSIKTILENSSKFIFYKGYFINDELVGIINAVNRKSSVVVNQLYVLPKYQRRGIGTKLLDELIGHFEPPIKIRLTVEEKNEKAIAFYKKYGFLFPRKSELRIYNYTIPCLEGELLLGDNKIS